MNKYISCENFCYKVTDGTHDSPKKQKEGKYLITSKHIKGSNINFEKAYKISSEDFEKVNKRSKVEQFDILISMIGTPGEYVRIEKNKSIDYCIKNIGLFKMNGDEKKAMWLYYYLKSPQGKANLQKTINASVQDYLTLDTLRKLPIINPDCIDNSKSIISLLSSLDDKIEINNKINQELEELGQALYTKWFVNFDFPNEEGKPYKSSGGKMIESELGMIPKGWKVGTISDISEFINGYAFKSSTYIEDGKYRIITIKNVGNRKLELKNNDSFVDFIPNNINQEQVLQLGDLLISLTGYTGRTCLNSENNALLNQRVAKIKSIDCVDSFIYNLFSNQLIKDEIEKLSHGSSQKNVSTKDIENIKIVIPEDFNIFKEFDNIANFKSQILSNMLENKKLEELRDFLIPQLMSENLKIKDLEETLN